MKIIDINGTERDAKKVFLDPEFPGYVRIEFKRHREWMTIKEFLQKNPNLKDVVKDAKEAAPDITGTVSSATNSTLKDTSQSFDPNAYMGYHVWIARGHGEGQVREILKNSQNTLTLNVPWETKPNNTSQYVIANKIDKDMHAMGNTLAIEDMKALEKKAIEMDIKRGVKPTKRLYTKDEE
jgi:hypothetical protein